MWYCKFSVAGYRRRYILLIPSPGPYIWSDNGNILYLQGILCRILGRRKIKFHFHFLLWLFSMFLSLIRLFKPPTSDCVKFFPTYRMWDICWRIFRNWSLLYFVGFLEFMNAYMEVGSLCLSLLTHYWLLISVSNHGVKFVWRYNWQNFNWRCIEKGIIPICVQLVCVT